MLTFHLVDSNLCCSKYGGSLLVELKPSVSGSIQTNALKLLDQVQGFTFYFLPLPLEFSLYKLIMRSDKPQAKPFQDWVTKVVLLAIRKDGGYVMRKRSELEFLKGKTGS